MTLRTSAISRAGARTICRRPWGSRAAAESAARQLEASGRLVGWLAEPVEVRPGVRAVATVREQGSRTRIGEVTYEAEGYSG